VLLSQTRVVVVAKALSGWTMLTINAKAAKAGTNQALLF